MINKTRRDSFKVSGSPELFIVPLLKKEIYQCVDDLRKELKDGALVLDVGCGNQPMRSVIEENKWRYKSLDIAQNDRSNVDFIGYIDADLTISETFDLIICTEVMEHVLHWEKAFANLATLCRDGGKVLITCPFFYPLHEVPYDYWRPTSFALSRFSQTYGFKIVKQRTAGTVWDVLGTLLHSSYLTQSETGLLNKFRFKFLYFIFKYLKVGLSRNAFSNYANIEGSWYLSNILVLERKIQSE